MSTLRNINLNGILGTNLVGVRGDALANTGTHSDGILIGYATLPADNAVLFRAEFTTPVAYVSGSGGFTSIAVDEDGSYIMVLTGADVVVEGRYTVYKAGIIFLTNELFRVTYGAGAGVIPIAVFMNSNQVIT